MRDQWHELEPRIHTYKVLGHGVDDRGGVHNASHDVDRLPAVLVSISGMPRQRQGENRYETRLDGALPTYHPAVNWLVMSAATRRYSSPYSSRTAGGRFWYVLSRNGRAFVAMGVCTCVRVWIGGFGGFGQTRDINNTQRPVDPLSPAHHTL